MEPDPNNAWPPQKNATFEPPYGQPVHGMHPQPTYQSTSMLPVISFAFGLVSLPLIVTCFLSIFTGGVAIITGHLAIAGARRDQRPGHNKVFARLGLVFGYFSLVASIALIVFFIRIGNSNYVPGGSAPPPDTNSERLHQAEMKVIAKQDRAAGRGNSDQARVIAERFAANLKTLSDASFTGGKERIINLSGGEFLTYCELHPDSCALIVHVPDYKDYRGEAREALSALAWSVAVEETRDALPEGSELTVAMRGTLLYGDILIGTQPGSDESNTPRTGKRDDLLPFFPDPADAEPGNDAEPAEDVTPDPTFPAPSPEPIASEPEPVVETGANTNFNASTDANVTPVRPKRPKARQETNEPEFVNKIPVERVAKVDASGWNCTAMVFLNDDRWLAVGRLDGTVTIFDPWKDTMLFVSEPFQELSQIEAIDKSFDGQHLLLGGSSGQTAMVDIDQSGALSNFQKLYRHGRSASTLVASHRFDFLLSGGDQGSLAWQPFDKQSAAPRILQTLSRQIHAAYLPSADEPAQATDGTQLIQFSLADGEIKSQFELGSSTVQAAAFSQDGQRLAISTGSELQVFNTRSGSRTGTYDAKRLGVQWSVGFHPTEPWLLSGGRGIVSVWELESRQRIAVVDTETIQYIQTFIFSDDGEHLAAVPASAGQSIHIFKLGE